MENRYSVYLPDTVKELQEFQKIGQIEGSILEEAATARDALVKNQWILTAERSGLLRMAKMMGFLGAEMMETEELREEVLYRWNSRSPYTEFHLQDWLDGCCGEGKYQINLEQEKYRLQLVLELGVKEKRDFLEKHLRKIVPANLMLDVDLNVNTYGDLEVLTYGQIMELGWTYGQIPFEDLTPYQK
ncbi:putative phage tail protein [Anaerotignum sp.]